MAKYQKLTPPTTGTKIVAATDGKLNIPDNPIIPFIEGDGTGPDIWAASQKVFDAAVEKAYKGKKKIVKEIKAEVEELIAGVGSLTKTVNR